jgi:hypothetical protein
LVVLTLVAIAILILGAIYHSEDIKWLEISGDFSKILLTAVFAGAILKILVLEGYFKRTLSELLYEDRWLEKLDEVEQRKLWRRLSLFIYAPFLNQGNVPELTNNLVRAIETNFDYTQKFYQSDWRRDYEIEWEPSSADKILVMKEKLRAKLIPFKKQETLTWTTFRTAEAHLKLSNYQNIVKAMKIDGRDPDPRSFTTRFEGEKEITTFNLAGKNEYNIFRERYQKWDIDHDPGYSLEATTVVDGGSITVSNRAKGLQVVVKEVGGIDLLESFDNSIVEYEGQYSAGIKTILLPKQGFQLMFLRRQAISKASEAIESGKQAPNIMDPTKAASLPTEPAPKTGSA